jgi:2-dehydropantoate 2-reductase
MQRNPTILIAGCGAIGSVVGCLLRQAGHDVTLFGRGWHLDAIRSGGLAIDGIWGHHRATGFRIATDTAELSGSYDLIIFAVKSFDTETMIKAVAALLKEDGLALSMQNGLGNIEALAARFGAERSLGANVLVGAEIPAPGKARVTVQAAPIIMGPLEVSDCVLMENIHGWTRLFHEAKIPCAATPRILGHLWAKVFYNAPLNALGALLNVHYGALGDDRELRAVMDGIIDEAFSVAAQREGVDLLWQSARAYREFFYSQLLPPTYNHRSSMLQDLQRARRTEIDAINGRIWQYGKDLGIATPYNETMTRLIREREKPRVAMGAYSVLNETEVKLRDLT